MLAEIQTALDFLRESGDARILRHEEMPADPWWDAFNCEYAETSSSDDLHLRPAPGCAPCLIAYHTVASLRPDEYAEPINHLILAVGLPLPLVPAASPSVRSETNEPEEP